MLTAVAEIVSRMISQIFKGVKVFVFNFPPGAATFDKRFDIGLINRDVGYPTAVKGDLVISKERILEVIDAVSLTGLV